MSKKFNEIGYDLASFSGRLNAVLDFVDQYPPVDKGRSRELAIEFGCSKGSARLWLLHDKVPTQRQLRQIIETSLFKIKSNLSVDAVVGWVTYGQVVPCPLTDPDRTSVSVDFSSELAKVVIITFKEAEKYGISNILNEIAEEDLEAIYRNAISEALKSENKTISPKTVRRLIKKQLNNVQDKVNTDS